MTALILWGVTVLLFAAGLAGVFVPALPGVGLVFAGALFYALATNFAAISGTTIIVFGVIALLAWLTDYLGAMLGARLGGGRLFTMIGMIAGAMLGVLFSGPPGLVIGALVGAFLGALYEGKTFQEAERTALFSFLGVVGARILQLLLATGIIVAFLVAVL